jgi:hypothetical protein
MKIQKECSGIGNKKEEWNRKRQFGNKYSTKKDEKERKLSQFFSPFEVCTLIQSLKCRRIGRSRHP